MRKLQALFCVCLFGLGQSAVAAQERITANIDLSEPPEPVQQAVEKFANDLHKLRGKVVELDLSIASHAGDSTPDYEARTRGGKREVRCEQGYGQRYGDDEQSFQIKFSAYNHLLLEIVHKTGVAFPFNHAACEYDAGRPDSPVLRIKGYFVPSVGYVPQAFDVLLIPIKP